MKLAVAPNPPNALPYIKSKKKTNLTGLCAGRLGDSTAVGMEKERVEGVENAHL